MKVLNLRCDQDHAFEGWFGSDADFQDQTARGLLQCPLCGSATVQRLPSAPRLNLSGARDQSAKPAIEQASKGDATESPARQPDPVMAAKHAAWVRMVTEVLQNTEDVGERFPEEARRIHYGESEARGIRGQASEAQRAELADEGIDVVALPLPAVPKGPAH